MEKPPKIVLTNSDKPEDPEDPYQHLGYAIVICVLSSIACISLAYLFLCKDYPIAKGVPPLIQIGHFWNFLFGLMLPFFQWEGFEFNRGILNYSASQGLGNWLLLRWTISILSGAGIGAYVGWSYFKKVRVDAIHKEGRKKRMFQEAYNDLAMLFAPPKDPQKAKEYGSGLVLAVNPSSNYKYDPRTDTPAILKEKKVDFIELPEDKRRTHSVRVGRTGGGKTQGEAQGEFMQIYTNVKAEAIQKKKANKEKGINAPIKISRKALTADTPKSDYSSLVSIYTEDGKPNPYILKIAPHEIDDPTCVIWGVEKDIVSVGDAIQFWVARISVSEKDPMWGNSAIAIGAGCTYTLQKMCPTVWNWGMLAYIITKNPQILKQIFPKDYYETLPAFGGAEQTLGGMIQNLGAELPDIASIAKYWDGFSKKLAVFQSTAKALTFSDYLDYILEDMKVGNIDNIFKPSEKKAFERYIERREKQTSLQVGETEPYSELIDFSQTRTLFKAVCEHLTKTKTVKTLDKNGIPVIQESWTWKDFDDLIVKPIDELKKVLATTMPLQKLEDRNSILGDSTSNLVTLEELNEITLPPFYWTWLCSKIHFYQKEWDDLESQERLSIGDWWRAEEVEKPILFLKPSEKDDKLTKGLIKAILYFSNSLILGEIQDNPDRKWNIIIDELASYGKIDFFVKKAIEMYRSRGVSLTLCFQSLSQLDEIYNKQFIPFITDNIAMIYVYGFNAGDGTGSADRMSKLVGQKTIRILKTTKSYGANGTSYSVVGEDIKKDVMPPHEFNSLLGVQKKKGTINYLLLANGLPDAYILEIPIIGYKRKSLPKVLLKPNYFEPEIPSIEEVWKPKPLEQVTVREEI